MKLQIKIPGQKDREVTLKPGKSAVGRGKDCEINILHTGISRNHVSLELKDGKVFVTDLGSSNGSKLGTQELKPNEQIEFTSFFPLILSKEVEIFLIPQDIPEGIMGAGVVNTIDINRSLRNSEIKTNPKKNAPRHLDAFSDSNKKKINPLVAIILLAGIIVAILYFVAPEMLGL